ncbi:hypothetical protein PLESTB_000855200 [Pleodorina starrii]|uniref:Peptidase M11 gametolysin domain-containing protein n=1 Tax=Pleodorina starrii TaxID=330485 RepID=A0A9W6F2U2_9CHLO|nr:hypothetical protein PLESTB_000855200 [Pleodorina starrii]
MHARTDYIELQCPDYRDPVDGFMKPDPNCQVPLKRVAQGSDEVEAFQREYQVETGDLIASSSSGSGVRRLVAGKEVETGDDYILRPGSIRVLSRADRSKEIYTGTTIELRAVVYILDFCGWMNPFRSAEEFKQLLFTDVSGSREGNLQLAVNQPKLLEILQWPQRRRSMVVLPREINCGWGGLADVYCNRPLCQSFIKVRYLRNWMDEK